MSDWRSKPRKNNRTSRVWEPSPEEFRAIIARACSIADALRELGMHPGAGNYTTINKRISEEHLDTSHFDPNRGRRGSPSWTLDEILVRDTPYKGGSNLKTRLMNEGLLQNECILCGLGDVWEGKPITHRLDHINGDSLDNRIENLRIVCPNCDSQLPTFSGRNCK